MKMITNIIIRISLLVVVVSVSAQNKVDFEIAVGYDGAVTRLTAGYSDSTTINYDADYEDDLPPFSPPQGITPTFRINREYENGSNELIYSYRDYRAVPVVDTIDYQLDILGTREEGKEFYFVIPLSSISKGVEEVRIIDNTLEGKLIDSNIIDGNRLKVTNRFINSFTIRVKYKLVQTSVEFPENIDVYYSEGTIHCDNRNYQIEIYGQTGQKFVSKNGLYNTFDVSNLPNGIYFAYIYDGDVVIKMLKIVKL